MSFINECYAFKQEALTKAAKTRNWPTYVFTHERPYRAQALYDLTYAQDLKPQEYWNLLSEVWKDSSNIWQNIDTWEELWGDGVDDPHRKFAMTVQDRKALKLLPDEFTVWRGVSHREGVTGLSWTINRDVAIWFAHRTGEPHIATGRVSKSDVLAMFMGGKEFEIVVFPNEVRRLKVKALPALTDEELT